jgi:Cdc6-like AAA superfamily ATPase
VCGPTLTSSHKLSIGTCSTSEALLATIRKILYLLKPCLDDRTSSSLLLAMDARHNRARPEDRGKIVFVTGAPGTGKTALIDEFEDHTTDALPIRTARGKCIEGLR